MKLRKSLFAIGSSLTAGIVLAAGTTIEVAQAEGISATPVTRVQYRGDDTAALGDGEIYISRALFEVAERERRLTLAATFDVDPGSEPTPTSSSEVTCHRVYRSFFERLRRQLENRADPGNPVEPFVNWYQREIVHDGYQAHIRCHGEIY